MPAAWVIMCPISHCVVFSDPRVFNQFYEIPQIQAALPGAGTPLGIP